MPSARVAPARCFSPTIRLSSATQRSSSSKTAAHGPAERGRILREARTASALNHPSICTIYEVGDEGGRAFIAMEYVDGEPLSAVIGAGAVRSRTR